MDTLATITCWLVGAQAMVVAKVQDHILKLLKSQILGVAERSSLLVPRLLDHDLTAPAILELDLSDLSKQLLFFLR
jgi:hypothetical protein